MQTAALALGVPGVFQGMLVGEEQMGRQVYRDHQGRQDPRALQVHQEKKVLQGKPAWKDHRVQ